MRARKTRKSRPVAPHGLTILRRGRGRLRVKRPVAEHSFDLSVIASREPIEPGMPEPAWPSGDLAFLTAVLRAQGVPEPLLQRIVASIPLTVPPNTRLTDRLAEALQIGIDFAPLEALLNARALLIVGPTGAGKTTLAAKLAAKREGEATRLLTTDVASTGGKAQLGEYAAILGIPLTQVPTPEALRALTADSALAAFIIDTVGIDAGDDFAWEQLRPWIAAADATPLLVLPANILVEDALTAARAFRALGGSYYVVTRFDMVRRVGGVLGAATQGLAVAGVSVTPHFAFGLRPMTAEILAWRLLSGALEEERWRAPAA